MAVNSGYLTEPRFMSNRREDENSAVEPVLAVTHEEWRKKRLIQAPRRCVIKKDQNTILSDNYP